MIAFLLLNSIKLSKTNRRSLKLCWVIFQTKVYKPLYTLCFWGYARYSSTSNCRNSLRLMNTPKKNVLIVKKKSNVIKLDVTEYLCRFIALYDFPTFHDTILENKKSFLKKLGRKFEFKEKIRNWDLKFLEQ